MVVQQAEIKHNSKWPPSHLCAAQGRFDVEKVMDIWKAAS